MPRVKNSPQKVASRKAWDNIIKPVLAEAKAKRGFMAEVARQFEKVAGREVNRQQVFQWLDRNKAKRVEPRLGTGQLLLQAIELARKEFNGKHG